MLLNIKKLFIIFCFFVTAVCLYSQTEKKSFLNIILADDLVFDDIRFLSLEAGIPFLSFSPPLSPYELKRFLNFIDENNLSQAGTDAYNRVLDRIDPKKPPISWSDELFGVSLNFITTIEGKIRFNEDISWEGDLGKVSPLISFPLQFFFTDYVQMYIEPVISVKSRSFGTDIFFTNLPDDFNPKYWALRSFASAGGSWWNFFIGRDHLYWGSGHTGSLSFSNDTPYYDFAKVSFFTRYFKYSFIVNHMPLKLNSFNKTNLISETSNWTSDSNKSINRYFYLHRLDVNILNKITVSAMEGLITGNSPPELRFLNPLSIYHSLYALDDYDQTKGSNIGSFFSVEINWNIFKPLAVYGQFVMNEVSLPSEKDRGEDLPPNGLGFLAGVHFSLPINSWGSLYYLEFIYTDPYLYILSSPFCSFIQQDYHYYLTGHSRDTISLTAGARFFNNDSLSFLSKFSWIARGQHNSDGVRWDWSNENNEYDEKTPSGIAENKFLLSLETEWKPLSWLALKAGITGIISNNNKHESGSSELGGQAWLSAEITY